MCLRGQNGCFIVACVIPLAPPISARGLASTMMVRSQKALLVADSYQYLLCDLGDVRVLIECTSRGERSPSGGTSCGVQKYQCTLLMSARKPKQNLLSSIRRSDTRVDRLPKPSGAPDHTSLLSSLIVCKNAITPRSVATSCLTGP